MQAEMIDLSKPVELFAHDNIRNWYKNSPSESFACVLVGIGNPPRYIKADITLITLVAETGETVRLPPDAFLALARNTEDASQPV